MPSRDLIYIHKAEGTLHWSWQTWVGKAGEILLPHYAKPRSEEPKTLPRWVLSPKALLFMGPDTKAEERGEPSIFACSCRMPDVL